MVVESLRPCIKAAHNRELLMRLLTADDLDTAKPVLVSVLLDLEERFDAIEEYAYSIELQLKSVKRELEQQRKYTGLE